MMLVNISRSHLIVMIVKAVKTRQNWTSKQSCKTLDLPQIIVFLCFSMVTVWNINKQSS